MLEEWVAAPGSRSLSLEEASTLEAERQSSWRAAEESQCVLEEDGGRQVWFRATYEWTRSKGCRGTATAGCLSVPADHLSVPAGRLNSPVGRPGCARHGDAGHDQHHNCCLKDLHRMKALLKCAEEQDWGLVL